MNRIILFLGISVASLTLTAIALGITIADVKGLLSIIGG